jgi:hypothetical protein
MSTTTLPALAGSAPSGVITDEQMDRLETFRGTFRNGHTDDDATSTLGEIKEITGRHFAIVWAFDDMWGLGGNSEIAEVSDHGRLRDCPSAWTDFLYDPENRVTAAELAAATPGNCIARWQRAQSRNDFNFFWRAYQGEAPKC